jgi:3'-5' exoribonuclease 1
MTYIIYDLEGTCWQNKPDGYVNETIEIGAVKLDEYGEVLSEFNAFIRPKIHPVLSSFCQNLTSISQIDVNRAEQFPRVIEDFMDWIDIEGEEYWLCSWGGYDKRQLVQDCQLHDFGTAWLECHVNINLQAYTIEVFQMLKISLNFLSNI